jgi:hypothetical protein
LTVLIAMLGLGAVVWQVRLDHNRRRAQTTLETWIENRDRRRALLTATMGFEKAPDEISEDVEQRRILNTWLNEIESIALGVNVGVFDIESLTGWRAATSSDSGGGSVIG